MGRVNQTWICRGVVVNPKLSAPCVVLSDENGASVEIFRMDWDKLIREGAGEMDTGQYGRQESLPAEISGLPRVHVGGGVRSKGKGYGTSLYTALTLAAHQDDEGRGELDTYQSGNGICSAEGSRSVAAERWWDKAYEYGLATSQHFDIDDGDRIRIDTYMYRTAEDHGLVVADMIRPFQHKGRETLTKAISRLAYELMVDPGSDIETVDLDALRALDLSHVPDAFKELLLSLAEWAEAPEDVLLHIRIGGRSKHRMVANRTDAEVKALRRKLGWDKLRSLP